MPNPKITIHNTATGKITTREMYEPELMQWEIDKSEAAKLAAEREAKATIRASALAKLAALGLSADEIAALQADGKVYK